LGGLSLLLGWAGAVVGVMTLGTDDFPHGSMVSPQCLGAPPVREIWVHLYGLDGDG
jgi:hypothetical protein